MHRFHYPEDGADDTTCLDQLPKRLNSIPQRGVAPDNDVGWGIHFYEGPHVPKIVTIFF